MARGAAAFWDRMARRYAAMPLADPAAFEATLARIIARLAPADRVLEVGCGTGGATVRLAPAVAAYLATDLSPKMLDHARARPEAASLPQLEFRVAEATDPGDPQTFDAVVALNLLHLLPDLDAGLAGLRDRLRPGGLLLSKTPCLAELSPLIRLAVPALRLVGLAPRVAFLRRAELEARISAAGFEILEAEDLPARRAQRYVAARRR